MKQALLALMIAVLFITSAFSYGDKLASISGVVKDAHTKIPLTEAVVTVSSDAFEGQRFALTDSTGRYAIRNLPAGNYKISFEMEGYEKFTKEDIALKKGMSLGVSFEMIKQRKNQQKRE